MESPVLKPAASAVDSLLLEVADVVNATLDLDTLLRRVSELVRRVIDYEIFAILLLNEKTQEMRIRFQVGHPEELAERMRVKVGEGISGVAAQTREPVLVSDVSSNDHYIHTVKGVRSELAIPLITKNRVIGVIDIEASQANYFTEEHSRLLTLIASRIAIGIENARLYTRVSRQAKTLVLLNEISRELTSILNLDQLFKRIGDLLSRLIDYQMFSILLIDPSGTTLQHRFSLRFKENIPIKHDIPLGKGLVGHAAGNKIGVLAPDVSKDPRYINLNPETRSELCVPLVYKDKVIGVLDLEHTRRGYFTEEHMRTITTLAAQVAISIENAMLYERIARQEKRLEQDLALARELQMRLLPPCCPVLARTELAAKFTPARAIGGDLYDFLQYQGDGGLTAVAIGDVSGKGAPAAIYAALVSGILRSHAAEEPGPADMLSCINLSLAERPIAGQFVSLIYALWDDRERLLRIANSGLPRPIYCHNGKVERIEATGLPLGLFATADYDEFTFHAHPGDLFVFFSDGILDARDHTGDMFGRERVERIVARNFDRTADEVVTAIFDAVNEYVGGVEAFDDQTVVALKLRKAATKPQSKRAK
ncbi:MAG TPA: SpoIIE family protein phosphatase [Clostridia bacterium]|nr:SpoIIE family protein phosphatase [Clostridia bacterium]